MEKMTSDLFEKWIAFSTNKSVMECEFFRPETERVSELLGDFAADRLAAFGEHASGSLFSFYSVSSNTDTEDVAVAWLDSEGAPCIIVCLNLKQFLSILPYGPGLIYTMAAVIENNLGEDSLLSKAQNRMGKSPADLLNDAKSRFPDVDVLVKWLEENNITISPDPIADIVEAHSQQDDLTSWLAQNLS